MKKLLITVATIAVVGGVAGASVNHYNNYKTNQEVLVKAQEIKAQDEAVKAQTAKEQESARFNKLLAECQKGVVAYDTLSPLQRTKIQAPSCL